MEVGWLQVPEDIRRVRAPAMAELLSAATGKKVSRGDALAIVLDLWAWILGQVDENAPDLQAEFARCTFLPEDRAAAVIALATGWSTKQAPHVLKAMADPMVRALVPEAGGWRVPHVADRYLNLSAERADARGRQRAASLARVNGWKSEPGNKWVHTTTGEVVDGWRALLAKLETSN